MPDFSNETFAEPITLAALATVPRWVAWQTEDAGSPEKPRVTKVPYDPTTGRKAKSNDSTTWATRAEAEACAARLPKPFGSGGVALCFGELDGLCVGGADFDSCLTDGRLAPWAAEAKEQLSTYCEVSPSGGGAKCFFTYRAEDAVAIRKRLGTQTGRKWCESGTKDHPPGIELYIDGRFFAVTDQRMDGAPAELRQVDVDTIGWLIAHAERTFPPKRPGRPKGSSKRGDGSRSARAMAAAARVKREGGDYEAFKAALRDDPDLADWLEEKGLANSEYEARRTWDRAGQGDAGAGAGQPWADKLIRTEGGQPAACEENVRLVLETDTRWEGVFGFDEFASVMVLRRQPPWMERAAPEQWKPRALAEEDVTETAMWLQRQAGLTSLAVPRTMAAVAAVCARHRFHPVKAYLDGLRWDGTPRLDTWLTRYVGAEDNDYHRAVGARWPIGAVARVHRPGCMFRNALILEGPQELKKSTVARVLGGEGEWFTDTPQDLRSKDSMQDLQGIWVIEIAELASLGTAGQERIKAFISSGTDRFRPSYGRLVKAHPRQCAFIGTFNPDGNGYLKDPTGGSRWWPVRCGPRIDIEALRRDREQLWAEATHRFRAGEKWWIDAESEAHLAALAHDQQEDRRQQDGREAFIAEFVRNCLKPSLNVVEAAMGGLRIADPDKVRQDLQSMAARALTSCGWKQGRVGPRGRRERRYFPPTLEEEEEGAPPPNGAAGDTRTRSHTRTQTRTREPQEPQANETMCPGGPGGPGMYSSHMRGGNNSHGANAGGVKTEELIFPANSSGLPFSTRTHGHPDTGPSPDGPVCTRQHCPGRWAKDQGNQRICRCADVHCYLAGLVTRGVPVQGVSQ